MRTRRILAALVVLLTTTIATTVTAQTPAWAAHKDGFCNDYGSSGDLCIWQNVNYSGGVLDYFLPDSNHSGDIYFVTGSGVNNTASSAANYDFGCQARLYNGINYATLFKILERQGVSGDADANFTTPWWDNVNDINSSNNWFCG